MEQIIKQVLEKFNIEEVDASLISKHILLEIMPEIGKVLDSYNCIDSESQYQIISELTGHGRVVKL